MSSTDKWNENFVNDVVYLLDIKKSSWISNREKHLWDRSLFTAVGGGGVS